MNNCPTCKHEAHKPGQCGTCNCGEDEIIQAKTESQPTVGKRGLRSIVVSTLQPMHDKGRRVPKKRIE